MSFASDRTGIVRDAVSVAVLCALAALSLPFPASAQGIKENRRLTPIELRPAELRPAAGKADDGEIYARDGEVVQEDEEAGDDGKPDDAVTVPPPAAVSVRPATHISLDTLGLYNESRGGLPASAWQGTDHARAVQLFSRLPDAVPSDSLRKLAVRLLLSSTQPPQSANIQQSIFRQRIETLLRYGEAAQALRLIEIAPQDQRGEAVKRLEYTAHLLNNDIDWVRDNVPAVLAQPSDEPLFWRKLSIFTLAKEGKEAEAQLGLDLLGEQELQPEAGFIALIDGLSGRSGRSEQRYAAGISLTDAALVALSGKDVFPEQYLETSAPVGVVRLVSENKAFPAAVREQAAKRLASLHASDKPSPQQQVMRTWFSQQFALPVNETFRFDDVLKQTAQKLGGSVQPAQVYRFHTLLQALGFSRIERRDMPVEGRLKLTRFTPAPWLRAELNGAVASARTAEVVLLAAIVAGQGGTLAELDDATLAGLVSALREVRLDADARALAVEAIASLY